MIKVMGATNLRLECNGQNMLNYSVHKLHVCRRNEGEVPIDTDNHVTNLFLGEGFGFRLVICMCM